jgi:acyl carrier protein
MMEANEVLKKVNEIFIDVLDNEDIVVTRDTTSDDIEEWDSLNHIQLVVAIEKYFNIRFTSEEILSYQSVGEMCDALRRKLDQ